MMGAIQIVNIVCINVKNALIPQKIVYPVESIELIILYQIVVNVMY